MEKAELERCLNDHDYVMRKYYLDNRFCMAPDKENCSNNICEAHTISKKYLRNIAQNGHVYMPLPSSHNKQNLYEFKSIGIGKATRISGFCEYHDNSLFESLEKNNSFSGEYNQIYDLTFRAICRELFQKKCSLGFYA